MGSSGACCCFRLCTVRRPVALCLSCSQVTKLATERIAATYDCKLQVREKRDREREREREIWDSAKASAFATSFQQPTPGLKRGATVFKQSFFKANASALSNAMSKPCAKPRRDCPSGWVQGIFGYIYWLQPIQHITRPGVAGSGSLASFFSSPLGWISLGWLGSVAGDWKTWFLRLKGKSAPTSKLRQN